MDSANRLESAYMNWHGHRIHVMQYGEGDPLLLITGLGGHTGMWEPILDHFPNHRIIGFDAPGAGTSSTPMFPVPISMLSHLAIAVLDHAKAEYADVVGYSYGGAIAQQLAYEFPARLRRLVLAATTCGVGGISGDARAMSVLSTPIRYYSRTYFERTAAKAFGGVTSRNAEIRDQIMEARRKHPPSSYGYSMQLMGASGWSSLSFLAQIPHETLVITGDDDPLVPESNGELLADMIPRARLEVVAGAGHLFLWDDAKSSGQRIGRFVDPKIFPKPVTLHA